MLAFAGCGTSASPSLDAEYQQWYAEQTASLASDAGAAGGAGPGLVNLADSAAGDYVLSAACAGGEVAHFTFTVRDEPVGEIDLDCGGSSQISVSVPRGDLLIEMTGDAGTWWWVGLSSGDEPAEGD